MSSGNEYVFIPFWLHHFPSQGKNVLKYILRKFEIMQLLTLVRSPLYRGDTGRRGVEKMEARSWKTEEFMIYVLRDLFGFAIFPYKGKPF